jgi:hypothetical protein
MVHFTEREIQGRAEKLKKITSSEANMEKFREGVSGRIKGYTKSKFDALNVLMDGLAALRHNNGKAQDIQISEIPNEIRPELAKTIYNIFRMLHSELSTAISSEMPKVARTNAAALRENPEKIGFMVSRLENNVEFPLQSDLDENFKKLFSLVSEKIHRLSEGDERRIMNERLTISDLLVKLRSLRPQ